MSVIQEVAKTRGASRELRKGDGKAAAIFLAPWFLGLGLITAFPLLASLYLSFTDYSLLEAPSWIGLENYQRMFEDPRWLQSLSVTLRYVLISVPLQLMAALALAMVLDRGLRGLAIYRSVYYLPSLLGSSVAIALLWRQVFGADGLVNQVLGYFGIQGYGWVSHPDYALGTLMILNVWTFGAPMIIFLAGLRQIPAMYYEAASIDGASKVRQFFNITIPLLSPIIFFNLVLQLIGAFQSFTQAFIVSGGTGGPVDSTLFYTLYLYQNGFKSFDMGYASAMAWFLLLIVAGMTAVNFLASKYWVFYDD
ncbi:carbohydrate ABC transporter membrane protein 1 (CUT1 family) [Isoptericola sp. CG 20/1183]|uniref:Carbohydrate ABC transporter membrane protein 1 (CUT1 family) n=1 Tax=Isoptericola halotolerans TaxID=300560 RepID=A0ABX5EKZ1_9MICO|nr:MULTISPECIES: sugar ABC transporter permease [Isoptericola]MCK0117174.1 sugar ABC transporter permease [Isoptericola sp. S6320L]PRZ09595.1 carbohydrate ABC transporter membrane protein 1 (CUT1 family) [Isoptericola sp. CG 20/1183]PRZ10396.1 carbohydrate ABC transporter membrane protein 1 (CUT1 family) [Isoptericola halotolerans]